MKLLFLLYFLREKVFMVEIHNSLKGIKGEDYTSDQTNYLYARTSGSTKQGSSFWILGGAGQDKGKA